MPHLGAHGYVQLTLSNAARGQAAIQAIRNWANTSGDLNPGESIDNAAWMEDPDGQPDNAGNRPFGDQIFVEVSLAGYNNPINEVAHARVEAIKAKMEGLKAGNISHFRQGLSHHWCCYGDF